VLAVGNLMVESRPQQDRSDAGAVISMIALNARVGIASLELRGRGFQHQLSGRIARHARDRLADGGGDRGARGCRAAPLRPPLRGSAEI
jgi:hypothetical protein